MRHQVCKFTPEVLAADYFCLAGKCCNIGLPNAPNNPWGSTPKAFQSVGDGVPKMLRDWINMPISDRDLHGGFPTSNSAMVIPIDHTSLGNYNEFLRGAHFWRTIPHREIIA